MMIKTGSAGRLFLCALRAAAFTALLLATGCTSPPDVRPSSSPSSRPVDVGSSKPTRSIPARLIAEIPLHRGPVRCVTVSADGLLTASGGQDGVVRVMRLDSHETVQTFRHAEAVHAVAFDRKGQSLVVVSGNTVHRYSLPDGKPAPPFNVSGKMLILAPDGTSVADIDGLETKVWDAGGRLLRRLKLQSRSVDRTILGGAFSPEGTYLLLAGQQQSKGPDKAASPTATSMGSPSSETALLQPVAYPESWIVTLSVGGRQPAPVFGAHGLRYNGVAVTADSRTWAVASSDTTPSWHVDIYVQGVDSPYELETSAEGSFRRITMDPQGAQLALIDDRARLFQTSSGPGTPQTVISLGRDVLDAAFTPDGKSIVCAGADGVVRIFATAPPGK